MPNSFDRLLAVCDKVVAVVRALPETPDAGAVERAYSADLDRSFAGRRVWVIPAGVSQVGRTDRGTVTMEYRVGLVVADRWADPGEPPPEWAATVGRHAGAVLDRLGDEHLDEVLAGEPGVWPETADLTAAYDPPELRERKTFAAEIAVAFREDVPV